MALVDIFPTTIFTDQTSKFIGTPHYEFLLHLINSDYNSSSDSTILTTVDQQLLNQNLFIELKNYILHKSKEYLNQLGHVYEDLQIHNSWGVYTRPNSESSLHTHSNSYISGVYYLTQGSNITFKKPYDLSSIVPKINQDLTNPRTLNTYSIPPQPGLLVLFPSTLQHKVEKSIGDEDRYSISFNIYPKGEFGVDTGKLFL